MSTAAGLHPGRVLILAPRGRDAVVAKEILRDARLRADICLDIEELLQEIDHAADVAVMTEEATRGDIRAMAAWVLSQPPWSDFPFVLLTEHGGGLERNPAAARLVSMLGNVSFLERPFHPTTLVSVVLTGLRGRQRQYECRRLNEELESRVQERTGELAAVNRQLLGQIKERENVESTLRQMQRLEAVGQLTSGVAHDFNNLLTVVLGNLGFVEKGLAAAAGVDGKLTQRLGYMRAAAERGAKLTDQLLSFSRRQRLEPRSLDLNETVVNMRDLLQSTMGGTTHIETQLQHSLWPAMVDPTQLELAVLNLAINARDAMQVGGSLTVETDNALVGPPLRPEEPPAGEYVSVCVSDTGTGMSEEIRAKVFEPFFTTKEVGKGSGLGLSQVLGFAKQSGGGVRINSRLGEGTSVYIYLPRAETETAKFGPAPLRATWAGAPRNATILLVDDDDEVREVTRAMLHELGHIVLEAGSGGAALDTLKRHAGIDLLIIDFAMPGMNGAEVARLAHAEQPNLPVLFVTGFADRGGLASVDDAFIVGKPFHYDEIAGKVQFALGAGAGAGNVVRLRR
ncbi:MAG TPA: ATP-binding protein [Xanthobacteraceae bacterium]|nr:ATP-binding protein [Xanthobacteraceae bacterium]